MSFSKKEYDYIIIGAGCAGLSLAYRMLNKDFKVCVIEKESNISKKNKFYESIIASDMVISASGTAILESALLERPTIAAYKVSSSSYFILKALVNTEYFTLPNILLEENIIPEYIQNFDENDLYKKAFQILSEEKLRQSMVLKMKKIRNILSKNANTQAAHELVKLHEKE